MASSSHRDSSGVRTAARAIIVRNDELLVVRIKSDEGEFLVLPGGGQNHGETLQATVVREVNEELGLNVIVEDLAYVREYVGKNHSMHRIHGHFHQVETVFYCKCEDFNSIGAGKGQDRRQVGFLWIPLSKIDQHPISPPGLSKIITQKTKGGAARYLGDVH